MNQSKNLSSTKRCSSSIQDRIAVLQSSGCCLQDQKTQPSGRHFVNTPTAKKILSKLKFRIIGRNRQSKEDSVEKGTSLQAESPLTELPTELKQRVASFLLVQEVMKLTVTSKSIRSDLDMTVVSSPLTDRASEDKVYATFDTQQCFAMVVPNQDSLPHTMNFCCDIISFECDGTIGIREHKIPSSQGPRDLTTMPFSSGKAVVTKDLYDERSTVLSFHPKPNKYYQFWIQTDGFDDDEAMRFENMRLCRTGFGSIPMDYTAYQYDVKMQQQRRRRPGRYSMVK